jgi:MATE family multidrug resistance protein
MQIRVLSAPAAITLFGLNGWLIAQERTRSVLLLQLWMNGLNILLDLWFVIGQGWGVQGVAWASCLSEISGLLLGLLLCQDIWRGRDWCNWSRVFDRHLILRMVNVNRDILLRTLILQCISVSFIFVAADFGDVELAATHVLGQFLIIIVFALDGFAFAAETLVGQAVGARSRLGLRRSALMSSYWAVGISLLLSLAIALFGNWTIELLSKSKEVQQTAVKYLPFLLLMPIFGVGSWMLDGIFIGATQTKDMRNMMAISLLIYGIAVISLVPLFDLFGLWAAFLISLIARGITLGLRYPNLEKQMLAES